MDNCPVALRALRVPHQRALVSQVPWEGGPLRAHSPECLTHKQQDPLTELYSILLDSLAMCVCF